MRCHCPQQKNVSTIQKKKKRSVYALLTFPKVPSAMSFVTVYSPSLDGGKTLGLSVMAMREGWRTWMEQSQMVVVGWPLLVS